MSQQFSIQKLTLKFKLVFIGDQAVGKTSIINRFIYDTFPGTHQPTVGIDFISKCLQMDNKTIRLQLWDTAGQERFRSLIPSYIRDSHVAIICYDVTNEDSFENVSKWLEYVKEERGNDVIVCLVANKVDAQEDRVVSQEDGQKFATENELQYYEVSAKDGTNISSLFKQIAVQLSDSVKTKNDTDTGSQQVDENPNAQIIKNLSAKPEDKPEKANQCQC